MLTVPRTPPAEIATPVVSYLDLDTWQRTVESCPGSTPFHHRNWLELLAQQYGFRPFVPALVEAGRVLAAVPFLETRGLLGARRMVSLPFTDCAPFLSWPDECVQRLLGAIGQGQFRHCREVVIRSDVPLPGAACVSHQVRHVLRTDRPWGEIQNGFQKSVFRAMRQAESHGLRFAWRTDPEAMDIFYRLHLLRRRIQGVPIQPKSYFARLHQWTVGPGLAAVAVVSRGDQPLSAAVLLTYHRSVIYKYSASDPRSVEYRPNDMLIFYAIQRAVESGAAHFDFGVSDKHQDGLRRFKSKWGAAESDVYHAYLTGKPRKFVDHQLSFKMLSFIIRRSPAAVCRLLGEILYRYSQ